MCHVFVAKIVRATAARMGNKSQLIDGISNIDGQYAVIVDTQTNATNVSANVCYAIGCDARHSDPDERTYGDMESVRVQATFCCICFFRLIFRIVLLPQWRDGAGRIIATKLFNRNNCPTPLRARLHHWQCAARSDAEKKTETNGFLCLFVLIPIAKQTDFYAPYIICFVQFILWFYSLRAVHCAAAFHLLRTLKTWHTKWENIKMCAELRRKRAMKLCSQARASV